MCVFVVALSSRALGDKWPNGIDFNFENAALHFSLYNIVGTPGGWGCGWGVGRGGWQELLCQRKHITEDHKHQLGGIYCTHRQAHMHYYTNLRTRTEDILHMS